MIHGREGRGRRSTTTGANNAHSRSHRAPLLWACLPDISCCSLLWKLGVASMFYGLLHFTHLHNQHHMDAVAKFCQLPGTSWTTAAVAVSVCLCVWAWENPSLNTLVWLFFEQRTPQWTLISGFLFFKCFAFSWTWVLVGSLKKKNLRYFSSYFNIRDWTQTWTHDPSVSTF